VISLRTGAVGDGWLPGNAAAMAHSVQPGTSRGAVAAAAQVGRLPYSRGASIGCLTSSRSSGWQRVLTSRFGRVWISR
jgi:hypothetical protein